MPEAVFNDFRGVIFDLDGTLIDSFRAIMDGFNATLPIYGLKPLTLEETKAIVGRPLSDTFFDLLGEEHTEEAVRIFRRRYKEVYLDKTIPLPHAIKTVRNLHRKGLLLGVATNKHGRFARTLIEHIGMGRHFTSVVGEGDTERSKPAPDMIIRNIEYMSIGRSETVFVGDSPVDIETGRSAGVRTIGITTGYHTKAMLRKAGAETVIADLSRLVEALGCS